MKLGIDVRPAIEEPAGIGKVVLNLTRQLAAIDPHGEYVLYANRSFDIGIRNPRFRQVVRSFGTNAPGRLLWHLFMVLHARLVERVDALISVGALQSAALTRDFVILIVADLTHVLYPEFHVGKPRLTGRLLLRRALRRSRRVVAISENTRIDILRYGGGRLAPEKVSVAHIACEDVFRVDPPEDERSRVRALYGLAGEYILFVGTIEPRKNLPVLIRAFAGVAAVKGKIELVIAGRKGWKWEETFDAARESGEASRIRFLEFVPQENLPSLYHGATAFVYPSVYEGFGIPPLEAMACGVPVITSSTSSLPEVVGEAALLVDPADVGGLRDAMLKMLSEAPLRQRLSREGKDRSALFSWERFARAVLRAAGERS